MFSLSSHKFHSLLYEKNPGFPSVPQQQTSQDGHAQKKTYVQFHSPTEESVLTTFPQIPIFCKGKNPGFNSIPQLKKSFWLFFRQFLYLFLRALSCQLGNQCRNDWSPKTDFVGKWMWSRISWTFSTAQQACKDGHARKNSMFNSIPKLKKTFSLFFRTKKSPRNFRSVYEIFREKISSKFPRAWLNLLYLEFPT